MKVLVAPAPTNDQAMIAPKKEVELSVAAKEKSPAVSNVPRPLTDAEYRLVIVPNTERGGYIYKTVNSYTGEVVSQRPDESVKRLGKSAEYVPGSLVSSRA
jgi:hypothetical protein